VSTEVQILTPVCLEFSDASVSSYLLPDDANFPVHAASGALCTNRSDPLPPSQKLSVTDSDLDTLHIGAGILDLLALLALLVQKYKY
jgi:hypothetical protein